MYKEPNCIKQCDRTKVNGVTTCTSCGRNIKPLSTKDKIKKSVSKTRNEKNN